MENQPLYRSLFFVCPTDGLEPIINQVFENKNYFYTSLGNSLTFDEVTVELIKRLILKHKIREIFFVVSNGNTIVEDALGNQYYNDIQGLEHYYETLKQEKNHSDIVWQQNSGPFTLLSHYIKGKIEELKIQLERLELGRIHICGKIYDQNQNVFYDIYSDLICRDYFSLN